MLSTQQHSHQLRSLTLGDEPRSWAELGFDVLIPDGPEGVGTVRLASTTLVLTGSGSGFEGWEVDGSTGPIDGLPTISQPSARAAFEAPTELTLHPNGITSIDHVVISTDDMERTAAALADSGLEPRGGRSTTSYGSPMRQQFYWLGDVILELVGPDSDESGSDTAPSEGPAELFGLALVAPDLEATLRHLGDLAGAAKDAVQTGRRIAGLRARRVGITLPLAVMSAHPG